MSVYVVNSGESSMRRWGEEVVFCIWGEFLRMSVKATWFKCLWIPFLCLLSDWMTCSLVREGYWSLPLSVFTAWESYLHHFVLLCYALHSVLPASLAIPLFHWSKPGKVLDNYSQISCPYQFSGSVSVLFFSVSGVKDSGWAHPLFSFSTLSSAFLIIYPIICLSGNGTWNKFVDTNNNSISYSLSMPDGRPWFAVVHFLSGFQAGCTSSQSFTSLLWQCAV